MDSTPTKRRRFEKIKLTTKLLIMVIFLGYMMIWIMMPTNTFWMHWLPVMQAKADSTFLGKQGTDILIHTLPVLFIALLSCLYLHLDKKYIDHDKERCVT